MSNLTCSDDARQAAFGHLKHADRRLKWGRLQPDSFQSSAILALDGTLGTAERLLVWPDQNMPPMSVWPTYMG